tara:strand:+ start:69181 stop:69564 length:384 start_codon:yes stop_codon:yes gene_type:complete
MLDDLKLNIDLLITPRKTMSGRKQVLVYVFILTLVAPNFIFAANNAASTRPYQDTINHPLLIAQNDIISSEQAIQIAKQGRKVKVLKVTQQKNSNRDVYRIKLITKKGLVRVILVDAYTGKILRGKR